MENYLNYLEYLRFNGGWFKLWTKDFKPLLVGYVTKVSPSYYSASDHVFTSPLAFSCITKKLYTYAQCMYEASNFLGKPSIEDIMLIKDKLNKEHKNFNVKTKEILVSYESN